MSDLNDWTPEERNRLLAWVLVDQPRWCRPATWLLLTDRLFRWQTDRALRLLPSELAQRKRARR